MAAIIGTFGNEDSELERNSTMEYMLLITVDESQVGPTPGSPAFDEYMAGFGTYNKMLMEGGHWINGGSLQPSALTTTVRLSDDGSAPAIVDGPFLETKEQLGGFYTISARDLDEALDLASKIPMQGGVIEVRPIAVRPDAEGKPQAV